MTYKKKAVIIICEGRSDRTVLNTIADAYDTHLFIPFIVKGDPFVKYRKEFEYIEDYIEDFVNRRQNSDILVGITKEDIHEVCVIVDRDKTFCDNKKETLSLKQFHKRRANEIDTYLFNNNLYYFATNLEDVMYKQDCTTWDGMEKCDRALLWARQQKKNSNSPNNIIEYINRREIAPFNTYYASIEHFCDEMTSGERFTNIKFLFEKERNE